ncbi:MAG: penicillin-binding transpeptidase domain-containing protein [Christensenellaceae bacterium]
MGKKIISFLLIIIVAAAGLFTGCATQDGAATAGYAFVQKIADQDYAGAFDYVYTFTSDVKTREDFVARYENIYDALEVTDITLVSRNVEQKTKTEYSLTYTLQLKSGLLGDVSYNYQADIVSGPQGYTILYTPSLILPMLEEGDRVRAASQSGARGEIFSIDGNLLAKNDFAQSIYIDLEKKPDIEQVKALLVGSFHLDAEKIQKKYDNAIEKEFPVEVLAVYPKGTLTEEQKAQILAVNGLGVDDERLSPIRYYPLKDDAAHVIGYVGSPSDEQIEQYKDAGITENSIVGKSGIELAYEETMRGNDGKAVYIEDEKGNIKQALYQDQKTDGSDVTLTIDSRTQCDAYTLLSANLTAGQSGAVVVMDAKTGDVEAMVSYPSYDNNLFNFPMDKQIWDFYNSKENGSPLYARTTQSVFTPGSTFKPFSSVPSIESGLLTESSIPPITITDNKWIPSSDEWNWVYPAIQRYKEPVGGDYNYEIALKSSDNIFFAYYAMKLGIEPFMAYMQKIGIGEAPTFELPLTKSNLLNEGTQMNIKLLADMGFGMGEIMISPLQMASMYTAFENDGDMLNPTIVKKVSKTVDDTETVEYQNAPTVFKADTMQSATIDMAKRAMKRTMEDGTGYGAMLGKKNVYGKTGSAVIGGPDNREVNWIIGVDGDTSKVYVVTVDAVKTEGTTPKLAILRGLIDKENYTAALGGAAQPTEAPTSEPTEAPTTAAE